MGRVRLPRARREELLDEYERSGISGVQFAAYVRIKYSTLANWIQKRERCRDIIHPTLSTESRPRSTGCWSPCEPNASPRKAKQLAKTESVVTPCLLLASSVCVYSSGGNSNRRSSCLQSARDGTTFAPATTQHDEVIGVAHHFKAISSHLPV